MAKDGKSSPPMDEHRAYLEAAVACFVSRRDEFGKRILEVIRATVPSYGEIQDPDLLSQIERDCLDHSITVLNALASGQPLGEEMIARLATLGRRRFETNVPLHALQLAYQTGALELARIMGSLLKEVCSLPDVLPALASDVSEKLFAISTRLALAISADYIGAEEGAGPARAERGPADDLLEGTVSSVEDARARAASLGLVLGDRHVVAIVGPKNARARASGIGEPEGRNLIGVLKKRVSNEFPSSAVALTRDRRVAVVVSSGKRPGNARTLAQRIEEALVAPARPAHGDLVAGVGCVELGASGIHTGYRQALDAFRMANGTRRVVTYVDAVPTLLLRGDPLRAEDLVRLFAVPLIEHDRLSRAKLIETIEAYVRADGKAARAAEVLNVHPHTVTARFEQVEKLTGLRPQNPRDLALLIFALEAMQVHPPTGVRE